MRLRFLLSVALILALAVGLLLWSGCGAKTDADAQSRTGGGASAAGGAAQHLLLANRYLALAANDASLKNAGKELIESGQQLGGTKGTNVAKSLSAAGKSLSTAAVALSPGTSMSPPAARQAVTGNALSPAAKPIAGQQKAGSPDEYVRLASRELAQAAAKLGEGGGGWKSEKAMSPPGRRLSAAGLSLSASGRSLSTSDRALSPAGKSLSQSGRTISPSAPVPVSRERYLALARRHVQLAAQCLAVQRGERTISPSKTSLSPAGKSLREAGKTLSATDKALSPAGRRLSASGKQLSAAGLSLSPNMAQANKGDLQKMAAHHIAAAEGLLAAASTAPAFSAVDVTLSPRQLLGDPMDMKMKTKPATAPKAVQ